MATKPKTTKPAMKTTSVKTSSKTAPASTKTVSKPATKAAPAKPAPAKAPAKPAPKAPAAKPAPAKAPAKPAPKAPTAKPAPAKAPAKPAPKGVGQMPSRPNLPPPAKLAAPPTIHPATPNMKKLVAKEILELREQLIADRARYVVVVANLHGESLPQSEGINPEEDGTELMSQLQGLNSAADVESRIRQIDAALRAIDAGTYGYCERCGNMINPQRLRALPSAKTCIRCQSEAESNQNGHVSARRLLR